MAQSNEPLASIDERDATTATKGLSCFHPKTIRAVTLTLLVVLSVATLAAAPGAASSHASDDTSAEGYAGGNIAFGATSNALVDYDVGATTIVEEVRADSKADAGLGGALGVDAGLDAVTSITGAELGAQTEASASVSVDLASGGELRANDNSRGVLQLHANGEAHVATLNLSAGATAEQSSDEHVVIETDAGAEASVLVVGGGEVTVNDEGHVTADLREDAQLVYRQYEAERSEGDEETEQMIVDGSATGEVYVQSDDSGETTTNTVTYADDTTIEVGTETRDRVEITAERTVTEGTVIATSVSEAAFEGASDMAVTVDGEAALEVQSASEAEAAVTDGDEPRYYVTQSTSMDATVDVLIGINEFSEREIAMASGDDGMSSGDGDMANGDDMENGDDTASGDGDKDDGSPGFGVIAALVAISGLVVVTRRINRS